jgi:hypothetical protein
MCAVFKRTFVPKVLQFSFLLLRFVNSDAALAHRPVNVATARTLRFGNLCTVTRPTLPISYY